MLIILNDDKSYLSWVTHHRQGFVLDGRSSPKLAHLVLHRATCVNIKAAPSKRTHWTTGGRFKACALDRAELEAWANEETGKSTELCPVCQPNQDLPEDSLAQLHLTKLGSDILDYVLDAALIHFDDVDLPYHLTVTDIAACMGKTPGQISSALHRLISDGVLAVHGKYSADAAIQPRRIILPTVRGIKTLSTFASDPDEFIASAIEKLLPQ